MPSRPRHALRRSLPVAAVAVVAALTSAPAAAVTNPAAPTAEWRLVQSERFDTLVDSGSRPWSRNSDGSSDHYNVDGYDNDGAYFDAMGGSAFRSQLGRFWQHRKAVPFGTDGWLTAELSGRDRNKDGTPENAPSARTVDLNGDPALLMKEPDHHGGVVVRSTNPLPAEYRVEVRLRTMEFGGMRNGSWDYPDGRVNGYRSSGCKTNHPWAFSGDFSRKYCDWKNVRTDANGFYYVSIMDYARPAPHNNIFVHTHRKVGMDSYSRYKYTGSGIVNCNPLTRVYETYASGTGNGVTGAFQTAKRRYTNQPGTEGIRESECGLRTSGALVTLAEIRPELMPAQSYTFAVERVAGGYTLELSGSFRHIGQATLRYHRKFVQDGLPIWHYNQTPAEYDGRFNDTWTYTGEYGTYTHGNTWPAGSAYPDYFAIGDPHTNYYEGSAHIDDVKLYVPAG